MPIKWTAPEILLGNVAELSTQSDVYVQYRFFVLPQLRLCYTRPFFLQLVMLFCYAVAKQLKLCETLPCIAFPKLNNVAKLELDSTLWNGCCYESIVTHVHFGGYTLRNFSEKNCETSYEWN